MRATSVLSLLLAFFIALATAIEQDRTVDIYAWPLSAPKPQSLAKITYDSTTANVKSFDNTRSSSLNNDGNDIVRIGFYHPSGAWSGIATAASNLSPSKDKKLQLHVHSNGELYHLGFSASDQGAGGGTSSSKSNDVKDGLSVEVVQVKPGPTPHLNKPIVTKADGTVDEEEPEKSFFQKYWWAIAGFVVLQIVMSGAKGE